MTFSFSALYELCCDFYDEIETITQKTNHFLEHFHTEERFRFFDAKQIKKQYLPPYGTLVSSLLSSLERSDRLALRLTALLESADTPDASDQMPRIAALWEAYEQYRAALDEFLTCSKRYFSDEEVMATKGTAPLVLATRTLLASQKEAQKCFRSNL